jgi:anti-anti-sigma regulatory factor
MSVTYEDGLARLAGNVDVEAAEGLLEWLQAHPRGRVDLAGCEHVHTANLQVLMAVPATISSWPLDPDLGRWLRGALPGAES